MALLSGAIMRTLCYVVRLVSNDLTTVITQFKSSYNASKIITYQTRTSDIIYNIFITARRYASAVYAVNDNAFINNLWPKTAK